MTTLKRVAQLRAGGTPAVDDPTLWDDTAGVEWVAIGDMTRSPIVRNGSRRVSERGMFEKRLPVGAPGTVLFAMYASLGAVATLAVEATWNQAIVGIDAREDVANNRFIAYWLEHLARDLSALARSNTQDNLNAEQVARLPFPTLPVARQCQIADFLDAEMARIDALIERKRRMIKHLEERKSVLFVRALEARGFRWGCSLESPAADGDVPSGWKIAHLSTVLEQLTNGYVGPTRDVLVDSGVKYIQSLHIKNGEIDFARGAYYVPPDWHEARPRIHLRPHDVLIVQTGDIGQVAVVPHDFGPASCHALQIARVRGELLTGDYLGAYLRSPFGRQSLLSRVTGALHPHLEGGIRDIPIVVPSLAVQNEVVAELRDRASPIDRLRLSLARQIDLLREHRQALVTAAVTGQLDVAKAVA